MFPYNLISGWPFLCDYRRYLEKPETSQKAAELLSIMAEDLTARFFEK